MKWPTYAVITVYHVVRLVAHSCCADLTKDTELGLTPGSPLTKRCNVKPQHLVKYRCRQMCVSNVLPLQYLTGASAAAPGRLLKSKRFNHIKCQSRSLGNKNATDVRWRRPNLLRSFSDCLSHWNILTPARNIRYARDILTCIHIGIRL